MRDAIAIVFGLGLIINAFLFVPQIAAIWRTRDARGVSLLTFGGFTFMQFIGAIHGYYQHDWSLIIGMMLSCLCCGSVTVLAVLFRNSSRTADS